MRDRINGCDLDTALVVHFHSGRVFADHKLHPGWCETHRCQQHCQRLVITRSKGIANSTHHTHLHGAGSPGLVNGTPIRSSDHTQQGWRAQLTHSQLQASTRQKKNEEENNKRSKPAVKGGITTPMCSPTLPRLLWHEEEPGRRSSPCSASPPAHYLHRPRPHPPHRRHPRLEELQTQTQTQQPQPQPQPHPHQQAQRCCCCFAHRPRRHPVRLRCGAGPFQML